MPANRRSKMHCALTFVSSRAEIGVCVGHGPIVCNSEVVTITDRTCMTNVWALDNGTAYMCTGSLGR